MTTGDQVRAVWRASSPSKATSTASTAFSDPQAELRDRFRSVHAARRKLEALLRAKGVPDYELIKHLPREDWSTFVGLQCGARTRAGTPCKQIALYQCGRCRLHGGKSTGPRTPDGKARSALNGTQRKRTP